MRVSIDTSSGLMRKLTVALPSADLEAGVKTLVRETANDIQLPGFRPGKVPISEVQRRFGARLRTQAAAELIEASLPEALGETGLVPAVTPSITLVNADPGNDLEYVAEFEKLPDIELRDLAEFTVRKVTAEVDEPDVDAMVLRLRERHTIWDQVDREARDGDRVNIDYAVAVDGDVVREATERYVTVGRPGLLKEVDAAVRGMSAGETRVFPATLPALQDEDDPYDVLAEDEYVRSDQADVTDTSASVTDAAEESTPAFDDGDPAQLPSAPASQAGQAVGTVKVNYVEEASLSDVDDELMDHYGIEADEGQDRVQRFRQDVRDRMTLELTEALHRMQRTEVFRVLTAGHEFEVPRALVDSFLDRDRKFFRDGEIPPYAIGFASGRVRMQLLGRAVVEAQNMEVDDDRLLALVDRAASAYEDPAAVRMSIFEDEERLASFESQALEDQVVDYVLGQVKTVEVSATYDQVMAGEALPHSPTDNDGYPTGPDGVFGVPSRTPVTESSPFEIPEADAAAADLNLDVGADMGTEHNSSNTEESSAETAQSKKTAEPNPFVEPPAQHVSRADAPGATQAAGGGEGEREDEPGDADTEDVAAVDAVQASGEGAGEREDEPGEADTEDVAAVDGVEVPVAGEDAPASTDTTGTAAERVEYASTAASAPEPERTAHEPADDAADAPVSGPQVDEAVLADVPDKRAGLLGWFRRRKKE